jgi:hypothetical protein
VGSTGSPLIFATDSRKKNEVIRVSLAVFQFCN